MSPWSVATYILPSGACTTERKRPAGIGNTYDVVGRYFSDHAVIWESGQLVTDSRHPEVLLYGSEQFMDGVKVIGFVAPSAEFQREHGIPNCAMCLDPISYWLKSASVQSAKHILRSLERGEMPDEFGTHIGRMFGDRYVRTRDRVQFPPAKVAPTGQDR